jgi:hypothetical protein
VVPTSDIGNRQPVETKAQYVKSQIEKKDVEIMGRNTTTVASHSYPAK